MIIINDFRNLFVLFLILFSQVMAWDPKNPPRPVKEVCEHSKKYWPCIDVFNTGSTEGADMLSLSYYVRDFAENNATEAINKINKTLIPDLPDPYLHEVMLVCMDAFTRLQHELSDKVNPMLVVDKKFEEAKAWVAYGVGLASSCKVVCTARPKVKCPLLQNVYNTQETLELLDVVLTLITEGNM